MLNDVTGSMTSYRQLLQTLSGLSHVLTVNLHTSVKSTEHQFCYSGPADGSKTFYSLVQLSYSNCRSPGILNLGFAAPPRCSKSF